VTNAVPPRSAVSTATPFHTLLVANRGEIARRVMRSARALGLRTVAVYSEADAGALHVREADRAVCVGPAPAVESYLNIAALIDAARRSGADAVHPGYGFLAEDPAFAQACADAGLVFVGPSPQAMAAMGDKAEAKRRLAAAGVPVLPGYDGAEQDDGRLAAEALRIGVPLMTKATAGGGGRGMRRVDALADFPSLLQAARREALAAFGRGEVLLERALDAPRHVEIQVLADRHGRVIHLGERDCSVQRRHQKLIEESPSPAVDAALRARMGAAAVAATREIGYEGAGTLEFLLDADGGFWFMEMNTRLQVEHPVTEAVTGLDLVALQLRIAAGEPLPLAQEDVRLDGHAIELRLCAEDARRGFLPASGRLALWRPPAGLRVEHALESGCAVLPHYDPMLAKLVAHGATRDEARRRLQHGLGELVALGIVTNQDFLARCLAHPVFADGGATTGFVERHADALCGDDPGDEGVAAAVASLLLALTGDLAADATGPSGDGIAGHALAHRLPRPMRFELDGEARATALTRRDAQSFAVEAAGRPHELQVLGRDGPDWRLRFDGVDTPLVVVRDGDALWWHGRGRPRRAVDNSLAPVRRGGPAAADGRVSASTSGRVVAVLAAVGAQVRAGQPLVTLEAMKMEHVHAAPCDGRVVALAAVVGVSVAAGAVLVELAPAPSTGNAGTSA
jgi:geranyl-CoA carboxylase alpha subunit